MDEAPLRARQAASQRGFYRAMGGGSPGARLFEPAPGVQATIVPVREWFSTFNSVLYSDRDALAAALPELARVYDAAGVRAWKVWVPPDDPDTPAFLEAAGHALDSTPLLMAASIDEIDLERRLPELDADREPSWREVSRCNDRAHGVLEEWSMAAVFEAMDDPPTHRYAVREDGDIVAALLAREHDGDCYLWFVAALPEVRRRGLVSELVRIALLDARERGCTTTSLESTTMAEPVYEQLGYRALGRYRTWERRAAG
jgi:ribosomal protein S18 acetylase RimI-like enzyme